MIIQKNQSAGFTLYELLLLFFFLSIFCFSILSLSSRFIDSVNLSSSVFKIQETLYFARNLAKATKSDVVIKIEDNKIKISNAKEQVSNLLFPQNLAITCNYTLGFKPSGNTKSAGTITIKSRFSEKKVTVGVGYGKISIK